MKAYIPTKYHMKLRVYQQEPAFGKGITELLLLIMQLGSLSAACRSMGMSSSKAWKILTRAEEDLQVTLIQGSSGGRHGGGTVVTPEGQEMLRRYQGFAAETEQAANAAFQHWFGGANADD